MDPVGSSFPAPFDYLLLIGLGLVVLGTWWGHALERRRIAGESTDTRVHGWPHGEPAHRSSLVGDSESGGVYEETAAS